MPHYRLLKAGSADPRDMWETDSPNQLAALRDFERRLKIILSLIGEAEPDYLLQSRTGQGNFAAEKVPVHIVRQ
jgi:hypothetical protein